ncbi:MAG TPA: multiheme c-type cytochrome [Terriglobia bacterium]|nr:multiheme c-type cytochrome [Terriglobia bacterium]
MTCGKPLAFRAKMDNLRIRWARRLSLRAQRIRSWVRGAGHRKGKALPQVERQSRRAEFFRTRDAGGCDIKSFSVMWGGFKVSYRALEILAIALTLIAPFKLVAQGAITANFPRTNWQPTRATPGAKYVGNKLCASCHPAEAATQGLTPMARALERIPQCSILLRHPSLTHRIGRYTYRVVTHGGRSTYTVTDGASVFSEPLAWAFGQGQAGQTYVYEYKGDFYESRVSFFNDTQSLDLTLGYSGTHPENVEQAAGRRISTDEARDCFSCHATAAVSNDHLQLNQAMPGITCEGCHGPGAAHVAAAKAGNLKSPHIFNPGRLDTQALSDFCGSCHRSWEQVEMMNLEGVQDVRFQPYRLANSRCFDTTDPRISCVACHNPHEQVQTSVAFYDTKCLACHLKQGETRAKFPTKIAAACPVSQKNCITCHMPKYEIPGGHYKFTDHDIRVVRAGEPYPY